MKNIKNSKNDKLVKELVAYMEKIRKREKQKHKNIPIGKHRGLRYCPICVGLIKY